MLRTAMGAGSAAALGVYSRQLGRRAQCNFGVTSRDGGTQTARRDQQGLSVRILVVEDDADIRDLVHAALAAQGHEVAAAPNGLAALDLAAAQPPDLILLDLHMPVCDGWEFARRYRELPPPHAPVVVMTATTHAGRRAREVQADGIIGKPFDLGSLVALVQRYAA